MSDNENKGILIYAQLSRNFEVLSVVSELASEAQKLAEKLDGEPVSAVVLTDETNIDNIKNTLQNSGFDRVYILKNKQFKEYSTDIYSKVIIDLVKETSPSIMLFGATTQGRDLAPVAAAALNTGLTADCTGLDINEKGKLAATRPTFGGNLMATILCKNYPQMATVRPKVLQIENVQIKNTEFIERYIDLNNLNSRTKIIDFIKNVQDTGVTLNDADIIVAGGKGVKNENGFNKLKELAVLLNGVVGATRGAVDMGLAESSMQIGQTGKTVCPKLYIAVGISGAIQHQVGMCSSKKIIAINSDENAPIFDIADVGIVGDLNVIIPEFINELKNRN